MSEQNQEIEEEKISAEEAERLTTDALLERPITAKTSDGQFYYIYPPSIGIKMLTDPILRSLQIDKKFIEVNSTMEMLRVLRSQRMDVLRLIAYHTFKRRSDAIYEEYVEKRIQELDKEVDDSDLLTLFSYTTLWNAWPHKMQLYYGMDKERETKTRVHEELSKKGGLVFGGRSLYGRLVDFACQRYGWQVGYVIWGVSEINLSMMMADSISSITMTKEEMDKMGVSNERDIIDADDPANWMSIREMFNK